jgi:ribosomal protein S18 acetylase RimI-like enzyme
VTAIDVGLLPEHELHAAADVLARALHDDPLLCYVLPDPDRRAAALPKHFAGLVRFGLAFGEVDATTDVLGAAVWQTPGADITPERMQAIAGHEIWTSLGEDGALRFGEVMDALQPVNETDVGGDHWYLMMVGVDPAEQGRGIGASVLAPGTAQADAARLPCYLVSFNERNLPFYQRLGFQVATSDVEPKSGLRFWTFLRKPKP